MKNIFSALFLIFLPTIAVAQDARQGDTFYTPTKLEWAALELQTYNGTTVMTRDSPLLISFSPDVDGVSITCLLQYTKDYEAAALKIQKDSLQRVFEIYKKSHNWKWLRLRFQEKVFNTVYPQS